MTGKLNSPVIVVDVMDKLTYLSAIKTTQIAPT
jgi:hypothetical protein